MADKKISALDPATIPLAGTEVLPIVQSGATVKVSVANLTAGRAISATELTLTTGNLIVSDGKGIDFSATPGTGTSELLADYEEGTWTPSISSLSGSITSVTSISGTYTKIGRQVSINFLFTITTAGTGAGALVIESLPFAVSAANAAAGTGREYFNTGFQMQCIANTTTKIFAQKYDGTYRGSDGDQFSFSMTYFV